MPRSAKDLGAVRADGHCLQGVDSLDLLRQQLGDALSVLFPLNCAPAATFHNLPLLSIGEGQKVIDRCGRYFRSSATGFGFRRAEVILIAYRHGLRASEACDLQWHQVELNTGRLHVRRSKRGTPSVHPIQGDELRALRRLQRKQPPGPHVLIIAVQTPPN